MKTFQGLVILGGLLLIGSVYLLFPSLPYSATHDGSITAGGNQYVFDRLSIFRFGHMGGQFSEQNGQALRVFVFTDSEYTTFQSQYIPQGLFLSDGVSSGSISVSFPAPGTYYVVFMHGTGFESSAQSFSFSISLDGYNLEVLVSGLGLLAGGVVLFVVGYRLRNKYLDERIASKASDVVMFDKQPPPSSPPPPPPGSAS